MGAEAASFGTEGSEGNLRLKIFKLVSSNVLIPYVKVHSLPVADVKDNCKTVHSSPLQISPLMIKLLNQILGLVFSPVAVGDESPLKMSWDPWFSKHALSCQLAFLGPPFYFYKVFKAVKSS